MMTTPSTTRYEPGDIVLLRFPFTDLTDTKKRPALIISPPTYSSRFGDVVILALTSQAQPEEALALRKWREAGLPKPTWVKPVIGTVASSLIGSRLGRLASEDRMGPVEALRLLIAPGFAV